ncbi:MAG: hypothetical protein JNN04_06575 [Cyclobacteriaceae bacterium]|nr:hypothetical protein [Cyclobacteriaceae bacterium]
MDTKKLVMGTVVGGVVYFILGWIIYGMLLMDMLAEHNNAACMRPEADMIWWAMIAGNVGFGALLTFVFLKSGVASFGSGAQAGGMIAFLLSLSVDLMMYSTTNLMADMTGMVIDIGASTVMGVLAGGAIGMVLGSGAKPAES